MKSVDFFHSFQLLVFCMIDLKPAARLRCVFTNFPLWYPSLHLLFLFFICNLPLRCCYCFIIICTDRNLSVNTSCALLLKLWCDLIFILLFLMHPLQSWNIISRLITHFFFIFIFFFQELIIKLLSRINRELTS